MFTTAFVFLTILVWATNGLPQGFLFPNEFTALKKKITDVPFEAVEKCALQGPFLPYYNRSNDTYDCHEIATRGPCPEDSWFVMNKDNENIRGVCNQRPCGGNDVLVEVDGQCIAVFSGLFCPKNMQVLIDPYGDGSCDCRPGFLPWREPKTGFLYCFQENLQGPCKPGQQYILPNNSVEDDGEDDPRPICVPTGCPDDQINFMNKACIPVVQCHPDEAIMIDIMQHLSRCVNIEEYGQRGGGLIDSLPKSCQQDQTLDHTGECKRFTRRNQSAERQKRLTLRGPRNFLRFLKLRRQRQRSDSSQEEEEEDETS